MAALTLAGCAAGSGALEPLPAPPKTSALAPTTSSPDLSGVALPTVARGRTTTTLVTMGPGRATVKGRVLDPEGAPAAGALVRVERMVRGAVAGVDVPTNPDGTWSLPGVLGGAYRARAWRVPDLAVVKPALFFVGAADTAPVELKLERHTGTTPVPAVAPSRPQVGQLTSLVVQVTSRSVDTSGVVQGVPMVGATLELAGAGGWTVGPPNPTLTDATGRARWQIVCMATGVQPLRLVVNGIEQFQLALPACVEPPPPPSTVPTPAGGSTTTTTTRAGATTTSSTTATTRPPVATTTTSPATTTTVPPTTTTTTTRRRQS